LNGLSPPLTSFTLHAARFFDDVEVDRIVLYAFKSNALLTSFRTAKLDAWVKRELDAMSPPAGQAFHLQQNQAHGHTDFGVAAAIAGTATSPENVSCLLLQQHALVSDIIA
jgi:hypothetical protein